LKIKKNLSSCPHRAIVVSELLRADYVGVLVSLWLFLFAAQPKEFFFDGLKKLELRGNM
jgi:hypothetical protein